MKREPGYYWVRFNQTIAPNRSVEKWIIAEYLCTNEWKVIDYNPRFNIDSTRYRADSDLIEINESRLPAPNELRENK